MYFRWKGAGYCRWKLSTILGGKVLANVVRNVTHSTLDLFGPA